MEDPELDIQVQEIRGDDGSYKYSFSYERATLYEFKYERKPQPDPVDPCYRCYRRIWDKEQMINVGVLYHKACFRCRICGLPLTMQTFYRNDANGSQDREVYCKTHVGKQLSQIQQERAVIKGIEDSYRQTPTGRPKPALQASPNFSPKPSPRGSPKGSPAQSGQDHNPPHLHDTSMGSSIFSVTPRSLNGSTWLTQTPNTMEYTLMTGGAYSRPRPTLKTYEDFEMNGVFDAQWTLEDRHHEEEERLQRFLSEEREKEMNRLDKNIETEKEHAAAELLANIEQMGLQQNPRNLVSERERIEDHFRRMRDDRLRGVVDKVAAEEKARSARMLDRQCQEMLLLIAEKDRELDGHALYDHSMRPAVLPPETRKAKLYKTPTIFEQIDKQAIELSNRDYNTYTDLVRDLTRGCSTELEKVRALFRWIISKDLSKNNTKDIVRPNSSYKLLKGVKSGKETYHQLFKRLCRCATVLCSNSIYLGIFPFNYNFLTDPEDYIYQHYPDDASWQLLDIPLPFSEFINLPVVKSPFFNYGLRFYSNYGATLTTDSGMVEVRIIAPKILGFGSLLECADKASSTSNLDGRTLLRYVKNEVIFTVNVPRPGFYYFSIYTGDYWQSDCLESACSFMVNCTQNMGVAAPSYPPVPFFGPTPVMENLGIIAENQLDPLIVSNSDYLEIIFKMGKDVKVTHTFQYYDSQEGAVNDIDRYVFLKSRNELGATYMIRCPKEGFYIFSLYATHTEMSSTDQSLDCAYRYLIICQEPNPSVMVFPKTYHRWQRCTLHEPVSGDLMTNKRYTFRLDIPQASEVFVVVGDIWYHLKRKLGFTWEGNIPTGNVAIVLKVIARFVHGKESSIFAHLLDYELVEDAETEI
ncbi:hillarin-like [Ruditapes philippinarum]|uniref:hillarin-like n=1 Tax=Ruditapes philippinarum TaxID=129788 RepID=UPI00295BF69D|nr:hillarin-like [Ruditapes philippinarum]